MKKYNVIYADPPWLFKTYSEKGKGKSPEQHYVCMTIEDIKNLPIGTIAEDDCVLFMWVTFPLLQEGLDTIKAWGFTYKTCAFNWIKRNKKADTPFWGCGYWSRANSEICLLATKGNPKRISAGVHQVIEEWESEAVNTRIEAHSKKPDEVRDRIVALVGDLPRIELFARQGTPGWDVWGNEVDCDIELLK